MKVKLNRKFPWKDVYSNVDIKDDKINWLTDRDSTYIFNKEYDAIKHETIYWLTSEGGEKWGFDKEELIDVKEIHNKQFDKKMKEFLK